MFSRFFLCKQNNNF